MESDLLYFLAQDEEDWHRADSDKYEAEGEGELYEFGQECLDRLSLSLGGKTIVPLASSLLPQLLSSQDWKQRHAALICLAQIAEGCAKVMQKNMSGLVDMCMRVRLEPSWVERPDHSQFFLSATRVICVIACSEKSGKQCLQHWLVRFVLVRRTSVQAGCVIAALSPVISGSCCCRRRCCLLWLQGLQDQHAKVRWAACQALGQMCTDLGPELQNQEHVRILPGLMAIMDDFSQPRVQAHASAAIVNFSEACEQVTIPISQRGFTVCRVPPLLSNLGSHSLRKWRLILPLKCIVCQ